MKIKEIFQFFILTAYLLTYSGITAFVSIVIIIRLMNDEGSYVTRASFNREL